MKTRLSIFAAGAAIAILLTGCSSAGNQNSSNTASTSSGQTVSSAASAGTTGIGHKVVLDFAGDCAFGDINLRSDPTMFSYAYKNSGSYTYPFDKVKSFFSQDNLTIVNFECTLTTATKEAQKQWHFRGLSSYAGILPASSVEVAVLTNNHAQLDFYNQGYQDTIKNFKTAGEGIVTENGPFIKEVNGVQVVIIGDSSIQGENTTVTTGVAERVLAQLKKYKRPDNIVIVDMHWGSEYEDVQDWQKTTAREFIDAGADAVVGQHPHMLNGIETYKGKYIVYSLGNFAFGGRYNIKNESLDTCVFRVSFTVKNGKASMDEAGILPCYITSWDKTNASGQYLNNYQPIPVTGDKAQSVKNRIIERSKSLENGITDIKTYS